MGLKILRLKILWLSFYFCICVFPIHVLHRVSKFAAFGLIFLCFLQWGECILSLQEIVPDWNSRYWGFWSLCCFHFQRKETGMHIVVFLMNVHFIVPLTVLEFHKKSSERSNIWYCGYWLDFCSLLCLIFSCGLLAM